MFILFETGAKAEDESFNDLSCDDLFTKRDKESPNEENSFSSSWIVSNTLDMQCRLMEETNSGGATSETYLAMREVAICLIFLTEEWKTR